MTRLKLCAATTALVLFVAPVAQAKTLNCASSAEVYAIQVSAVQQQLTDAALACGPDAVAKFNRFQTTFGPELRKSDATLLKMFKRLNGVAKGNAEYDAYKTRAIAHAEQRRTKPGAHADFCHAADVVFAAALALDKPVLEDFVSGVPVNEANPVDTCEIKVAVNLTGVQAGGIVPTARPAQPGDPINPNLFPN